MIVDTSIEEPREWKSCCLSVDKSMVKYVIQVGILGGLVIFSAVMLVVEKECESQRNFSALLMISLGTLIPSPKINKN